MASQKQIEANRLNAIKNTGPRAPASIALASRNALRARPEDLSPENERALGRLARDFHSHLRPDGRRQSRAERALYRALSQADCFRSSSTIRTERNTHGWY